MRQELIDSTQAELLAIAGALELAAAGVLRLGVLRAQAIDAGANPEDVAQLEAKLADLRATVRAARRDKAELHALFRRLYPDDIITPQIGT